MFRQKNTPDHSAPASVPDKSVPDSRATKIAIVQNYYTPYRAALFERLGERVDLSLHYLHQPSDEGRAWVAQTPVHFKASQSAYRYLGKILLVPVWTLFRRLRSADRIVLLDHSPSNLCMILLAAGLRLFAGKPVLLWVEHTSGGLSSLKSLYRKLCTFALGLASNGFLAFSDMTLRYLAETGIGRKPVFRIAQAALPPPPGNMAPPRQLRRFGYLGTDCPRKNLAPLLAALRSLDSADVELHLAGMPRPANQDDARLHWHGTVEGDDKEAFFAAIDVLVLPSLDEPWGMVVNEALSRGRLCLTSSHCGASELVGAINPDFVFEPTPDDIARALKTAMAAPETNVTQMQAIAAEAMSRYSLAAAAEQLAEAVLARAATRRTGLYKTKNRPLESCRFS